MATVNDVLLSEAVRRHIELQHYSNAEVQKIIALLNRVDADLIAALQAAIDRGATDFTVQRIDALLHQVRAINTAAYQRIDGQFNADLGAFAGHEANAQYALLDFAVPAEISAKITLNAVTANQVRAAAMARPFQGRLLSEWMNGLEATRAIRIRDAVRMGFVQGQTISEIVTRIRGTRAASYADGLLEAPRRDLEAIVRTAIAHTASVARDQTAQANADILAALAWVSTLDTRTTLICVTHDGERYSVDTHKPLGPKKLPWLGGPGQAHWQCRSTATYVTKSWKDLGFNLPELSPGTRASMDGSVPANLTYADWLKQQSMSRITEILGPARAKLYRDGKLDLTRFVNDKGRVLTLEELKARDAAAFAKAGI